MQGAAAWVTVKVWPAIVAVALRDEAAVFAPTLNVTVPLPLPLAPLVTVSHPALLAAVQAQPVLAVTATLAVSPAASALAIAGLIE